MELRRVGWGFISLYTLAFMSTSLVFLAPLLVTLALKVNSLVGIEQAPNSLSVVTGTGALLALVGNPFFGKLSDRTSSPLGMRRPWMVIGLVVDMLPDKDSAELRGAGHRHGPGIRLGAVAGHLPDGQGLQALRGRSAPGRPPDGADTPRGPNALAVSSPTWRAALAALQDQPWPRASRRRPTSRIE
jgi:MFS family permease